MKRECSYSTDFIDENKINTLLTENKELTTQRVKEIIAKAREARGLTPEEMAALIQIEDKELIESVYDAAKEIKEKIYGKRVVLFAPLYLSNYCCNSCTYCAYRRPNKLITRRKLSQEEIVEQIQIIEDMGHKRIAMESGEDNLNSPIEYIVESIKTIYNTTSKNGSIRRINVNIAATTVEEFRILKEAKIGTYVLFQETYHRETYRRVHPAGPKSDYDWHTTAMHRAMEAGIDDVSIGILFGLYDYKFELMSLLLHALDLEDKFGVGPHAISVPRIREAVGVDDKQFPYAITDEQFKKIVAIIRLAVPYTGLILSTREDAKQRDELLSLGVSQISAGSCTGVGGYSRNNDSLRESTEQFTTHDNRTHKEVIQSICQSGYIPSYCTACYRASRTGERFMKLAKSGQIHNTCQPNAILTFKEYLIDYADPETRRIGEETIKAHLEQIPNLAIREKTIERLKLIEKGQRDLYF